MFGQGARHPENKSAMFIDISPLRRHRDFRLLFIGQLISFLGSMVSYMAVPYQVYQLTKSNAMVGALGVERGCTRVRPLPSSPILVEQRVPIEDLIEGTPRRPEPKRVPSAEHLPELLGAPAVLVPRRHDQRLHVSARPVGTLMRSVAAVGEAPVARPTPHPFIARRSADAVSLAELGHRPVSALKVAHEARALVRQIRFHPRHLPGVNDPAGLASTINPVYTYVWSNVSFTFAVIVQEFWSIGLSFAAIVFIGSVIFECFRNQQKGV
jgi:hypothetical protein